MSTALKDGQIIEFPAPTIEQIAAAQATKSARDAARPAQPISGVDFIHRLTADEYADILNAARTMLIANQPQLSIWIDTLRLKGQIVVTDQAAIDAKAFLIVQNLLTQVRADLIFAKG